MIVFGGHVCLHFLHVLYFFFVTTELLLHFLKDFITCCVSLFYVIVSSKEFLGLVAHTLMQLFLLLDYSVPLIGLHLIKNTNNLVHQIHVSLIFISNSLKCFKNNLNLISIWFMAKKYFILRNFELLCLSFFLLVIGWSIIVFLVLFLLVLNLLFLFSMLLILLINLYLMAIKSCNHFLFEVESKLLCNFKMLRLSILRLSHCSWSLFRISLVWRRKLNKFTDRTGINVTFSHFIIWWKVNYISLVILFMIWSSYPFTALTSSIESIRFFNT